MAFEELCMYCFENRNGADVCPHCGRDSRAAVPQIQMLPGSLVYHNRFLIGRALGQDANGIVYGAYDTKKQNKLRIREFLPRESAERRNDGRVVPLAGMEDNFLRGKNKLRSGVEDTEDPAKRHFYFEENGTAYIAQRKGGAAVTTQKGGAKAGSSRKALIAGVAVALVAVIAIVATTALKGAFQPREDVTTIPAVTGDNLWTPVDTPSPTPAPVATLAGVLKDPELTWSDVNGSTGGNDGSGSASTPAATNTPKPTNAPFRPATVDPAEYTTTQAPQQHTAPPAQTTPPTTGYTTIDSKSPKSEIQKLQQRLIDLGWLDGVADGKFGKQTKQAIKAFQKYYNDAYNPTQKLSEDGVAGPKTLESLFNFNAINPATGRTAEPTNPPVRPTATPNPVIDQNADSDSVYNVQRRLIALGLLSGDADGLYGASTEAAVRNFQAKVNEAQGLNVLDVTGKVDSMTKQYLDLYYQLWEAEIGAATEAPTEPVVPEETDIPDQPEVGPGEVDPDSPKESIAYTQQMLIAVGLLPAGSDDGVMGAQTVQALANFQRWVNDQLKSDVLAVTGKADAATLQYLEQAMDYGMTYTPVEPDEPEETEIPTVEEDNDYVDDNSETTSVKYVQQLLIRVGYLRAGSDDGSYGDNTTTAVRRLQQKINEVFGEGTVPVSGKCDARTLQYLEYYAEEGTILAPTTAPESTDPPALNVSAPSIHTGISDDKISFSWNSDENVYAYDIVVKDPGGNTVWSTTDWENTSGYLNPSMFTPGVKYTISIGAKPRDGGATVWSSEHFTVSERNDDPIVEVETPEPNDGETYYDEDGILIEGTPDPNYNPVSRVNMSVNGSDSDDVVAITGDTVNCNWGADGDVDSYSVNLTDEDGNEIYSQDNLQNTSGSFPASQLKPGVVYTISVSAQGADDSEPVWSTQRIMVPGNEREDDDDDYVEDDAFGAEEALAAVDTPDISIGGTAYNIDGVPCLTGKEAIFSWMAGGAVDHYDIYLTNEEGETYNYGSTEETSNTIYPDKFPAGSYTIYVGAVPVGAQSDEDIVWASTRFIVSDE